MTESLVSLKEVDLLAPMTGVMVPLEDVPDPVFSQKMLGDGFSVDPLGSVLTSPIDGEVADVQPSGHAVTIRSSEGLEILMHIGLDTVRLAGEGFTVKVTEGTLVKAGDPLIEVDLDGVGRRAKSLLTQIVITNSEVVDNLVPVTGVVTAGVDVAATVELQEVADAEHNQLSSMTKGRTSPAILVPNPTGLHARPTAVLVGIAKKYDSDIRLRRGDESANAKSIMSVMNLAVACGDKVSVTAHGDDADEAVTEITQAIKDGLGEECPPISSTEDTGTVPTVKAVDNQEKNQGASAPLSGDPNILIGAPASPGLAVGTVVQLRHEDIDVTETASDHHVEIRKLNSAIDRALLDLSALQKRVSEESSKEKAEIFAAHQELLSDPDLLDLAKSFIDKGKSAAFAWRAAFTNFADRLEVLSNEVMAGRAVDVRDVGRRVLEELTGARSEADEMAENTILIAEELTPSYTAQLDISKVIGLVTTNGGVSSHVAIIARSMDIPCIAGIEARALDICEGERVVLDGSKGTLQIGASEEDIDKIIVRQKRIAERKAADEASKDEPAVTRDGYGIHVVANIGGVKDACAAAEYGAEGIGLLRSEFLFMGRSAAPSDEEQKTVYSQCLKTLKPGEPLIVRTLDVGGDKPVSYLPIPAEENPFLGIRGVRASFERVDVFRSQIRAILQAAEEGGQNGGKLHLMFPMVATIEEWRKAKAIFDEERDALGGSAPVSVGIMMEVPSVAVMAEQFAAEAGCDFFSVGTNDLTSYTLAMDRGHPKLASQVDPCNPAVLALIGGAAEALHKHEKWIGVCGGIASDPQAVPILLGLGVDELSCSIPAIPTVKAVVRANELSRCKELAQRAVACSTPSEVRELVPMDEN